VGCLNQFIQENTDVRHVQNEGSFMLAIVEYWSISVNIPIVEISVDLMFKRPDQKVFARLHATLQGMQFLPRSERSLNSKLFLLLL